MWPGSTDGEDDGTWAKLDVGAAGMRREEEDTAGGDGRGYGGKDGADGEGREAAGHGLLRHLHAAATASSSALAS